MIIWDCIITVHLFIPQFTDTMKEGLESEVKSLIEAINNPNMKEVKGLEDRLYGLEQLLFGARKLVQEQNDMAQVFTWVTILCLKFSMDACTLSPSQY